VLSVPGDKFLSSVDWIPICIFESLIFGVIVLLLWLGTIFQ
jgi:hypothetical protein